MDLNKAYQLWCDNATADPDLSKELEQIKGNDEAVLDRFYRSLEFGTAGLRGVIGAGTNRMNIYTVNQATQGLADYLNQKYEQACVAIAYDSRIKSDLFAKEAASVLAGNGIRVQIFPELVPTPCLSFAVRRLKCQSGIILTASHNPSKYNGYKCYGSKGFQMTDEDAAKVYEHIQEVDIFSGVKKISFEEGLEKRLITYIQPWLMEEFLDRVQEQSVNPSLAAQSGLKVIYTPLNGTGNKPVRSILNRIGIKDVTIVKEQENPDGKFPTCPFPNPEIQQVFEIALEMAKTIQPDLLLATDPDCDRVGIAVKDGAGYRLMSGNEVGALLMNYLLSQRKEKGTLPIKPVVVKTIVSTELCTAIAKKYDCELANLLTGFKYIGELVTELEEKGEAARYVFGFEESYGYLSGTHARDKDAVVASMLICEMAAYYKTQGKTLVDAMNDLYQEFGLYLNSVMNFVCEGAQGMEKMAQIMTDMRNNPPTAIAGEKITFISDYLQSTAHDVNSGKTQDITLPKSNVLSYKLDSGASVIVRPSGTEPKIKVYITALGKDFNSAEQLGNKLSADMKKLLGFDE